jgi:hypothetical protein
MTKLTIFLFTCLFLLSATPSRLHASVVVAQEETRIGLAEKMRSGSENFPKMTSKKTEKRLNRFFKKLERKAEKMGVQLFGDPMKIWLWLCIIALCILTVAFSTWGLEFFSGLCILGILACLGILKLKSISESE